MPKNVGDLGKLNVAKGFKKLPNLVTLVVMVSGKSCSSVARYFISLQVVNTS